MSYITKNWKIFWKETIEEEIILKKCSKKELIEIINDLTEQWKPIIPSVQETGKLNIQPLKITPTDTHNLYWDKQVYC